MTLELSPIGILLLFLYFVAPELFYIPVAVAMWLLDCIFGKGDRKP